MKNLNENKFVGYPGNICVTILFYIIILFGSSSIIAQWEYVGNPRFANYANNSCFIINNETPYVAYQDWVSIHVDKFDGSNWLPFAILNTDMGRVDLISLTFDGDIPIVAFTQEEQCGHQLCIRWSNRVFKFDGTDWINLSPGRSIFESGDNYNPNLLVINHIIFLSYIYQGNTHVIKFNGSRWDSVGTIIPSTLEAKIACSENSLYMAFSSGINAISVMKYEGNDWAYVGIPGFLNNGVHHFDFTVENNIPYVAVSDPVNGNKASVMRFDGTNWLYVGIPGFSSGTADNISIAINYGIPFVAFSDGLNGGKSTVMKFESLDWQFAGYSGFSDSSTQSNHLAINYFGTPYLAINESGSVSVFTNSDSTLTAEFSSFVSVTNGRNVILYWTTTSETNNSGFDIERKSVNGSWTNAGFVAGHGTVTSPVNYTFTDIDLATGTYNYRLKQIDLNGNFQYYNLSNDVSIGIPSRFEVYQNYPNPFNPSTKISFALPIECKVNVTVFDLTGKEIVTLVNEVKTAGFYSVDFNAGGLSSGIYFYRISAGNYTATRKMMLIR